MIQWLSIRFPKASFITACRFTLSVDFVNLNDKFIFNFRILALPVRLAYANNYRHNHTSDHNYRLLVFYAKYFRMRTNHSNKINLLPFGDNLRHIYSMLQGKLNLPWIVLMDQLTMSLPNSMVRFDVFVHRDYRWYLFQYRIIFPWCFAKHDFVVHDVEKCVEKFSNRSSHWAWKPSLSQWEKWGRAIEY